MGGYFQTSREIFSNPIWKDVKKFRLFLYIVGNAVFAKEGVRVGDITVQRGQFLRSYRNLCKDLEYEDKNTIKTYGVATIDRKIKQLIAEQRLIVEETDYGTLFTVVNYEEYQGFERYKKQGAEQQRNTNEESYGTAAEQQRNNNKKVNKVNIKPSRHKYETCDMEMAELLFSKMLENNPGLNGVNLELWANDCRLMREIDNRTLETIRYLINWSQADSFWKTNILSMGKLRKQCIQLMAKAKAEHEKKKEQPAQTNMYNNLLTFEDDN
jgi:hypothetical protein